MPSEQPFSDNVTREPFAAPPYDTTAPSSTYPAQPSPYAAPAATQGLSDSAAGALAYITIVPALIFLLVAPYNTKPFIRFHAFQCLGLFVTGFCLGLIAVIPILGWIVWLVGMLALAVTWILSLFRASQGSFLKVPVVSEFAAQQSGYRIAA